MRFALAAALALTVGLALADDEQALALWRNSVRHAFQQARAHEADINRGDAAEFKFDSNWERSSTGGDVGSASAHY